MFNKTNPVLLANGSIQPHQSHFFITPLSVSSLITVYQQSLCFPCQHCQDQGPKFWVLPAPNPNQTTQPCTINNSKWHDHSYTSNLITSCLLAILAVQNQTWKNPSWNSPLLLLLLLPLVHSLSHSLTHFFLFFHNTITTEMGTLLFGLWFREHCQTQASKVCASLCQ